MTIGSESASEIEVNELLKELVKPFVNGGGERKIVKFGDKKIEECEMLIAKYGLWDREDKLKELLKIIGRLRNPMDRLNSIILIGRGIILHKEERIRLDLIEKIIKILEDLPTDDGNFIFIKQILYRRFRTQLARQPNGASKQLERIIARLDEVCIQSN